MLYELRIYYIYPERMEAIHKRFSNVTLELFEKHGMKVCDFWEDAEGKNIIYYTMEHEDMETRNKNFEAFAQDPDWIEARNRSEEDGLIVEKVDCFFMNRVFYSPMNPN